MNSILAFFILVLFTPAAHANELVDCVFKAPTLKEFSNYRQQKVNPKCIELDYGALIFARFFIKQAVAEPYNGNKDNSPITTNKTSKKITITIKEKQL